MRKSEPILPAFHPMPGVRAGLYTAVLLLLALLAACQPVQPVDAPRPAATTAGARTPAASSTSPAEMNTPTPAQTAPAVSRLGVEPADLAGVSIQFWHPYTGETEAALTRLIETFNATNEWKIRVDVTAFAGPDELERRMAEALAAGKPPDLAAGYLHQALTWEAGRPLANLQTYVDDPIWGYSAEQQADFYPAFWEQDMLDDRRVGLPFQRSAQVLFYNISWAMEMGYRSPPATPQQFADQACAAADANDHDDDDGNDGTGGLLVTPNYAAALSWIYSFGGSILRPGAGSEQNVYRFNTASAENAFTFLRDLYDDGCAWAVEKSYTDEEFAGRLALFASGSLTDIPFQAQVIQRSGSNDQWTVIGYPSPDGSPVVSAYGPSLAIFITTPQRQLAAWALAKWLLEPANHARLAEAGSAFPLRQSELAQLDAYQDRAPQWAAALELLPAAKAEPPFKSWETVRWAVSDAFTQLFRSYFSADQVLVMLSYLDRTAAELHLGPDASIFNTPEASATPK